MGGRDGTESMRCFRGGVGEGYKNKSYQLVPGRTELVHPFRRALSVFQIKLRGLSLRDDGAHGVTRPAPEVKAFTTDRRFGRSATGATRVTMVFPRDRNFAGRTPPGVMGHPRPDFMGRN